jgi:hypothetical protein
MLTSADLCERIRELQKAISEGTVNVEIRKRSARVQVLQNLLDGLRNVIAARAQPYGRARPPSARFAGRVWFPRHRL